MDSCLLGAVEVPVATDLWSQLPHELGADGLGEEDTGFLPSQTSLLPMRAEVAWIALVFVFSHPSPHFSHPETSVQTSSSDSSELPMYDSDPWRMYVASPHTFEAKTQGGSFLLAHATRDAASRRVRAGETAYWTRNEDVEHIMGDTACSDDAVLRGEAHERRPITCA